MGATRKDLIRGERVKRQLQFSTKSVGQQNAKGTKETWEKERRSRETPHRWFASLKRTELTTRSKQRKALQAADGGGQEALNVKCRRLFENLHVDRVTGT